MTAFRIPFGAPGEEQRLDCLNWAEAFPYFPDVRFHIWHDGNNIHLKYKVLEQSTKAEQTVLGGPVYEDSCVECFIKPSEDDPRYYNFEWNAAGKLAMACRTGRTDPQNAPIEVLKSVKVNPSLGCEPFAERAIAEPWTLEVEIPASALFNHGIENLSGKTMEMNLYKCGDGLAVPHFVTWRPIGTANPDYHRPEYFVKVVFE